MLPRLARAEVIIGKTIGRRSHVTAMQVGGDFRRAETDMVQWQLVTEPHYHRRVDATDECRARKQAVITPYLLYG